jgi:hypothetical protein
VFKRWNGVFFHRLLPLLFACCALAQVTSPAHALDLDALIGFGQSTTSGARYRPETWTPLTVYMTGQGARGTGQLQVTAKHAGHVTTYTRRVALRDGAMNDTANFVINLHNVDSYGQQSLNEINIELLVDGRKIASKKMAFPGPVDSSGYNVLALTRDSSGLNFLTKKKLGLVHRHTNPASLAQNRFNGTDDESFHNGINPNAVLQLLYTDPRALPAGGQGYEAIDALALADQPLDSLTEDQAEAIKTYVREGGLLLISGGGDLSRLRSQFFADLLPITPHGVTSTNNLAALEKRYGQSLGLTTPTALTEGALKPGAYALFGGQERPTPLVSARPYGAGRVVFTSFDFVDPTFRGWKAAPALWRDLLRCGNEAISPRDLLAANTAPYQNGGLRMVDALAGKQASAAPPIGAIGGFLVAYILLLVPINYFLLKRLDRREMAWVSIPILIIGFTATSYVMALGIKGGLLSANRIVVVETTANSDQAAAYGQLTIYSPRRAAYDIAIASPSGDAHAFAPREVFAPGGGINGDLTIDSTAGAASIRGAMIRLWDKRSFDSPLPVSVGGGVEAKIRVLPDKRVQVVVTNKTPYVLQDCALIADDENIDIGALAPGQASKPHEMKWATRVAATSIPLHSHLPLDSPEAAHNNGQEALKKISTHDKIMMAFKNTLNAGTEQNWNNPYGESGRGYGHSINAFIGWFSDPLMNVQIDGKPAASGEEVNLLVAHLPAPPGAPTAPHGYNNPFDTRPVLNLEDELPPGARKAGRGQ